MNKLKILILLILIVGLVLLVYKQYFMEIQTVKDLAIWRLECELGVINCPNCPVDGGWSPWSPWAACRGPCDELGTRRRTRQCNNPPPTGDGLACDGPDSQSESCYLTNCTIDDYRDLVRGNPMKTEAFQRLAVLPALMERCLQMECPYEAIEASLGLDNCWQLSAEVLWNSLLCVKHNLGCPVLGEWGPWGAWSSCGARCGTGYRWRLRRCDTPPPSDHRMICVGSPLLSEECEGNQCAIDVLVVERDADSTWSDWGEWSQCSESCGFGARRRRRVCNERVKPRVIGSWGTHCAGSHDEFEVCEQDTCQMDGGWSGWGAWGPCSQTCGIGKKSRSRSCTRPVPTGGGAPCVGAKTETGSCYLSPCNVFSHVIALFHGESLLRYFFENKRSSLFHFYIRFLPHSPHGTLVRRGPVHKPLVRLSLQKRRVCLDAGGSSHSCILPRICTPSALESGVWHNALITITSQAATLRVDDAPVSIKGTFNCDPELLNEVMDISIGERFHGAIQDLVLNFIPLNLGFTNHDVRRGVNYRPTSATNIVYETANIDEAFLVLDQDQYLRLPCFDCEDDWSLELTLKPKRDTGILLFMCDDANDNWLRMSLQNMRFKLYVKFEDLRAESSSSMEYPNNQWLDITLMKNKDSNTIEATINREERLHIVLETESPRRRRRSNIRDMRHMMLMNDSLFSGTGARDDLERSTIHDDLYIRPKSPNSFVICSDEFFVGGIPGQYDRDNVSDDTTFSGTIATITINNVLLDLHDCSVERYSRYDDIQLSSRTASISGSYHEVAWGKSNRLNLTCLHARSARSNSLNKARWLFLDTGFRRTARDKSVRSVDDGKILRLVASAIQDLRGFYTCRAHSMRRTRNIITYGVVGSDKFNMSAPNTMTGCAVLTTLALIISTFAWLIIEGFYDMRNGFGFFRDAHFTPEQEADAVCTYIDNNLHLYSSPAVAEMAKERARNKARRLASHANFAAQEPEGRRQMESILMSGTSSCGLTELPALPEVKSPTKSSEKVHGFEMIHEVYRCEPSYVSSPRHGSNLTSSRTPFTSSSPTKFLTSTSPRIRCSRLLRTKRVPSSCESLKLKLKMRHRREMKEITSPRRNQTQLTTIQSSGYVNMSPGQKILMKFRQLKYDDW